jgi:hypothetical protein
MSRSTPSTRPSRRARLLLLAGVVFTVAAVLGAVLALRLGEDRVGTAEAAPPSPSRSVAPDPLPDPADPASLPADEPEADPLVPLTSADTGARDVEAALTGVAAVRQVRYAFDAGPGRAVVDTGGQFALRPLVAAGGVVGFARHGAGYAVRFPARCQRAPAECPRAILESNRADVFNAGTRPLRYGASVFMTRADTAAGANVLQKGFSVGGGTQYKLQVDGRAGRPSCVLANGRTIYRVSGPVGVADGRWHSVVCTRVGARLSIAVDGRAVSRQVPGGLSISNNQPLRIGGKNVGPNNDQFAGRLDNVFVTLY